MSQKDAEESAVRRFGPPGPLAREFHGFSLPLKVLLALASLATMLVACWLFFVIAVVLPRHDPARIPMWTGVAIGFLGYSALSIAYLILGPRMRALQASVLILSVLAIGLGAWAVFKMFTADNQRFEGYLLLMGLILAGHGAVAFVYTAISSAIARRIVAH